MYRARAARAGPEPGSPGRFGILSTGQLRDLLQDEPKLDRIVRLSRKVTRGARARGGCVSGVMERTGRGLRGPGDPASGGHPPGAARPRDHGSLARPSGPRGAAPGGWGAPRSGLGRVVREGAPGDAPVHPRDGREACPPEDAPGRCVLGGGRWRVSCVVGGPGSAHPRSLGPERGGALLVCVGGGELKACLTPGVGRRAGKGGVML